MGPLSPRHDAFLGDCWRRQSPDIEGRWENMVADSLQVVVLPPRRLGGGSHLLTIKKYVEKYCINHGARSCERNFRSSKKTGSVLSSWGIFVFSRRTLICGDISCVDWLNILCLHISFEIINDYSFVEFEVPTAVAVKNTIFWDVMLCSLVQIYRYLGWEFCFHLQGNSGSTKYILTIEQGLY
jgi:hypothetical protein